jgi:hypothetical protein
MAIKNRPYVIDLHCFVYCFFYVVLHIFTYINYYCTGYFSEVACPWKRPPVTVYQYSAHTHGHGKIQGHSMG